MGRSAETRITGRRMMEENSNDDLGWQRPTATSRKFHYFVQEPPQNNGEVLNWQRSMCGRYGLPVMLELEQDIDPPNDESCKKCSTKWEETYGHKV
jgi:hypothetical protein